LFCGEPLPAITIEKWDKLCENSLIENIYGPTEATIAISNYKWKKSQKNKVRNGIVSIGKIFSTQNYCIINENNELAEEGQQGELCLQGSQVIKKYWGESESNQDKFLFFGRDKKEECWYKTGDIVAMDKEGDIFFLCRKDFQIKIRGYRVELEEINNVLRKITNSDVVITIPNTSNTLSVEFLYTFLQKKVSQSENEIISACRLYLPEYMIPRKIFFLDHFPLNNNGKIDRTKLITYIK